MKTKEQSLMHRVISNTGWQIGQNIYSMLLSLIVGSLSARYLGPSNYGILGYGATLVTLFSSISKLGMDSVVVNEIVKKKENSGIYLGTAIVMRLIASVFSVLCVSIVVMLMEPENKLLQLVTFLQAISLVLQVHEVFNYWFQVELKSKYYVIASILGLTIMSAWRIYLLATGASVQWFALSSSIQAGVVMVVTLLIFIKLKEVKLRFSIEAGKMILSKSHHFIISSIAITLYMQTDKMMLGKMVGTEIVGYYTAAMTIATLWEFVPGAIVNSVRPVIIADREEHYEKYIRKIQLLMLMMTFMSVGVGIVVTLLDKVAIIILFGEKYLSAAPVLAVLIWSTGFAQIGTARSIWIVAEDYNPYQKYMVIMGAIVNALLNYFGIRFFGMIGAAYATLLSQAFVQFIAPLFFKKTRIFNEIYFSGYKLLKSVKWEEIQHMIKRK